MSRKIGLDSGPARWGTKGFYFLVSLRPKKDKVNTLLVFLWFSNIFPGLLVSMSVSQNDPSMCYTNWSGSPMHKEVHSNANVW